ncbi:hypothetical protein F7R25_03875 [Burkholderia stagnalis]|uniref:Uncharacterized protein n=1 Tax=Burkholderia stagnalis TaxID=1503054 RepID=A0A6L3N2Y5_9BURK|nr:hypothetical protein [Burkholderia stagnalis]KAB0640643.1 hypothetical protein F7R25_03875 [Burkholderia stagnalis]
MKTIRDFIEGSLEQLREQESMDGLCAHGTAMMIHEKEYADEAQFNNLVKLRAEQIDLVMKIKNDCNKALNEYMAYFNETMKGSEWRLNLTFHKERGRRRGMLTLHFPKGLLARDFLTYTLDDGGITDLATPQELLDLYWTLEEFQERIFHDKLVVDMNKKEAPTGTRRQKI